jgi:hypothetical protein
LVPLSNSCAEKTPDADCIFNLYQATVHSIGK